ncbi:MAG: hypothetical protein IT510_03895 [Sulfuritalea sp.]|jgi:hypothetical protein|nr:hypothetical protein [Azonexus sp.]MCC7310369.1 hypothetical protein [Sulfuritalea sp.]
MGALMFSGTRTRDGLARLAILLSTLLVVACGDTQMAFFSGDDRAQTVSLVREQAWFGGPWQTTLIVANSPKCQRRYSLEGLSADELGMDVYRPEPSVFIFNTGKRWYVTELQNCGFQTYKKPPPEPGEIIGNFRMQDGNSRFLAKNSTNTVARGAVRPPAISR